MERQDAEAVEKAQKTLPSNPAIESDAATVAQLAEEVKSDAIVEEDYQYITGIKLITVIGCVTLVAFLLMLDQSIIATAIPQITSDFSSLPDVGWYGSSYLLASASFQPLTGTIFTYFRSKSTFISFLALFELGSLLCGVANSSKMLIVGRAVAGLGSSGLINGAFTIIAACVPLAKRPIYLGMTMSIGQLGIAFGPLIGGALTQYTTWRWCFYINLPIGGVTAALLLLIKIPDRTAEHKDIPLLTILRERLDLLGFAIFAPAAIQFLLALQWGGTKYRWDSSTVIGLFCGAAGTICCFLAWEYKRGDAAMIPFSMMRKRIVWCSCLVNFFFMGGMLSMSFYLPIYFQAVKGVSPTMSGVYLLPSILSQLLLAGLSGWSVSKIGYYTPWSLLSAIVAAIGYGLLSTLVTNSSTGHWVGYQVIVGFGRGCGMQMLFSLTKPIVAVQNSVSPASIPVAMAMLIFVQTFGGSLFLALSQTAFTNSLGTALKTLAPDVTAETLLDAGARGIRQAVPAGSLNGVLLAYSEAISHVFYICAGAAVGSFAFSWGIGWKNVKKSKTKVEEPKFEP